MDDPADHDPELEEIARQAAAWVLRDDRGLSPQEQDGLFQWLAADPRHGEQLARHRQHWRRLERLGQWAPRHSETPNPDLLAPASRFRWRRFLPVVLPLGLAASIAVVFLVRPSQDGTEPMSPEDSAPEQRVLADGSVIELNHGAVVTAHFTAAERKVHLERGEAYFTVAKDPTRPFIVVAGSVAVRAVGTAFNVRLDSSVVEVLVTHGRVKVDAVRETSAETAPGDSPVPVALVPLLEASQRVVVSLSPDPGPPGIATLMPGEIERVLSWQRRLLNFTAAPLSEVVDEFNRRNAVQLVVVDPELASIRISAAFRSDNINGFVHLLEAGFGARVERRGEGEILLRKALPTQP